MREGLALSIQGYIIFIHLWSFKIIVIEIYGIIINYFYCHTFHTWASGSDERGNPIPRIGINKLID